MNDSKQSPSSFRKVIFSVLAALFGVQSEKGRVHDFSQRNPLPFIAAGILLIALFVLLIYFIVRTVITVSGA